MSQLYSAYEIIQKKRDKQKLSDAEIKWFIDSLLKGAIEDYQMSALLMAIYLNGMTTEETKSLTNAMLYSGKVLDFKDRVYIDKHSTGGVGDKTSFILAPIAAALGVKVPMIAGRGLGHTGGTIDKIEAVKGFNTSLDLKEFEKLLKKKGMVLIGQTKEIAPADKKIYALRDVTATIESIPLITASIMSKKLAEGASGIVMDIKTGSGAFMKNPADAKKLAKSIADTGTRFGKNMMTMITDMNQPLGLAIGNSLELIECVDTLKGNGPADLTEISLALAGGMVYLAGLSTTHKAGIEKAREVIKNGQALKKFRELIINQGGDPRFIDQKNILPIAKIKTEVRATKAGFIHIIDGLAFGMHCVHLGGGRKKATDKIDFGVGLVMNCKIGDQVKKNDLLVTIYSNANQTAIVKNIVEDIISKNILIKKLKPTKKNKLIVETKTYFAR